MQANEIISDEPANSAIRRIIRRYYTVWWSYSFASGFLFGVYPIFLRSRGLNQFEMNSVLATYFAVTFLTDVPTGAFADALGRRRSFMLGCALRTIAFLVYFFAYHYPMFILGESIDGVGTTFCNGAIDAWGVDALDSAGYAGLKDRLFSRISQLTNLGFMASAIIGAYVAYVDIAWPWLLGAAGYLVSGIVGALLMDEASHRRTRIDLRTIPAQVSERVIKGLRRGFSSRTVLLLSLANGMFFGAWAPYWLEWPQFFNDTYTVGVWVIGWIFSLFTVARIVGAEGMVRFRADENARTTRLCMLTLALGMLMFAAGAVGHRPSAVLAIFVAFNVCMGAFFPLTQSWFNEQIGAGERATLLSFSSTFSTLFSSIGLLAGGLVADRAGIQTTWQVSGVITLFALPCYLALRSRAVAREPVAETS
jgi:MFS family permease